MAAGLAISPSSAVFALLDLKAGPRAEQQTSPNVLECSVESAAALFTIQHFHKNNVNKQTNNDNILVLPIIHCT